MDLQTEQEEISVLADTARKVGAEVEAMDVELRAEKRITLIDAAKQPRTKDELKQIKASGAVAAGAFLAVLFGISFWEYRAGKIGSAEEVMGSLGIHLIGTLPALPGQPRRRLARAADQDRVWQSILVDSIDATRTMLLHASRDEAIRVVMVTSAAAEEGKTSLACHLAASLARSGRRTLLIDGDLRRPSVHRLFNMDPVPGVSELLRGEAELNQAIRPTDLGAGELDVILAGAADDSTVQSLSRGELQPWFDALKARYDFIIVDSSPLLQAVDGLLLSQHVDAAIFSILRDVSRVHMVRAAYDRIGALGVRVLGAVVAGTEVARYQDHYGFVAKA